MQRITALAQYVLLVAAAYILALVLSDYHPIAQAVRQLPRTAR